MLQLRSGDLAYYDGLHGIVPCKVLSIARNPSGGTHVTVRFTANRGAWRKGDAWDTSGLRVLPRKALSYRTVMCGRILPYEVIPD